jgi:hypothetical protein
MAPARPVAAEDGPEIVPIADKCPVSEGGYRYFSDFFEYRIRVWLSDCPWYHGDTVVVRGSLVRTDPVTGPEQHEMTVYCEPGAPRPDDDRPHAHNSPLPEAAPAAVIRGTPPDPRATPPVADPAPAFPGLTQSGEPHHADVHRPPDYCALSIVVPHPPVEHAHYEGELRYPAAAGPKHETLALDCTTVEDFGGCDPPGSLPGIVPNE